MPKEWVIVGVLKVKELRGILASAIVTTLQQVIAFTKRYLSSFVIPLPGLLSHGPADYHKSIQLL